MPAWMWTTIGWTLFGVGVVVGVWALFGDRARGKPRCRRCRYSMLGMESGDAMTCPECGKRLRPRDLYATRRRWVWFGAGMVVLLISNSFRSNDVKARGWYALVPTWVLVERAKPTTEPVSRASVAMMMERAEFMSMRGSSIKNLPTWNLREELYYRIYKDEVWAWLERRWNDRMDHARPDERKFLTKARDRWAAGTELHIEAGIPGWFVKSPDRVVVSIPGLWRSAERDATRRARFASAPTSLGPIAVELRYYRNGGLIWETMIDRAAWGGRRRSPVHQHAFEIVPTIIESIRPVAELRFRVLGDTAPIQATISGEQVSIYYSRLDFLGVAALPDHIGRVGVGGKIELLWNGGVIARGEHLFHPSIRQTRATGTWPSDVMTLELVEGFPADIIKDGELTLRFTGDPEITYRDPFASHYFDGTFELPVDGLRVYK